MFKATLATFTAACLATSAFAAPAVEETFDYIPGTLTGNNGGTGWLSPWGSTTESLDVSGGEAVDTATDNGDLSNVRQLDTDLFSYGSGSIWAAVTMDLGAQTDPFGVSAFIPFANGTGWDAQFNGIRLSPGEDAFGSPIFKYELFWQASGQFQGPGDNELSAGEHLLVFEMDMDDNKTHLYINPDLSDISTPPATPDHSVDLFGGGGGVLTSDYEYAQIWSAGSQTNSFDNIRYGSEFSDVVIPEPASMALLAIGGAALIARRRSA